MAIFTVSVTFSSGWYATLTSSCSISFSLKQIIGTLYLKFKGKIMTIVLLYVYAIKSSHWFWLNNGFIQNKNTIIK